MKINKQTNKQTNKQKYTITKQNQVKKKTNRIFPLSHTRDKTKKTSFFFIPSPKLTIFLILYTF